jgi:3-oxoacyl-[acyl-carrier-protein] synthase-1
LATLETELLPSLETLLGFRLHAASKLIPMGRVACAVGVQAAARLINMDGYRHVIVAGTDSYLVPSAISSLDGRNRILTERNSNGFIPGEAGAAVLLARDDGTAALRIRSLGAAIEAATIESELPLKGDGLALAYRQALDSAGLGMHEVDFRIADLSGEQYWFKEAALAQARVMRQHRAFQDLWHPADCIGETGAAAAACLMGVVWHAMRKFCAPGPLALAQACNDDGRRIVMILDGTSIN